MFKHSWITLLILVCSLSSIDRETFKARRVRVQSKLGPKSAMVLVTSDEHRRNGDVNHEFRPDSDFWYLTGHPEPAAKIIIVSDSFEGRDDIPFEGEIIFARPRNPRWERWTGKRLGSTGATDKLGFRHFAPSDSFEAVLRQVLPHVDTLFVNRSDPQQRGSLVDQGHGLPCEIPGNVVVARAGSILHPMRHIKTPEEIELIQKAVDVTGEALVEAMVRTRPRLYEYNIKATVEYVFTDLGSERLGFPSIIASGPNALILHYTDNNRLLGKGDLLLMDVGAEYEMYTADITRTIPVSGTLTQEQKELYRYVLKAQQAAFDSLKMGMTLQDIQSVVKGYLKNKGMDRYLVHGSSHWLGLDVHDVSGTDARIQAGSVFTIEPGIYIPENDESLPESYRGIGIRIEDDVLMTKEGPVWLSANIPREIDDIEKLKRKRRRQTRRNR